MGSFDWGSTLRRTVEAQQPSASNEYKLLKMFCYSNGNSVKKIYLYLRECQKIYGNDTISKIMIFCYKVECSLYDEKWLTLCPSDQKSIFCQKIRSSLSRLKLQKIDHRGHKSIFTQKIKSYFFDQNDKNRLYIFFHQPNCIAVLIVLANFVAKIIYKILKKNILASFSFYKSPFIVIVW